MHAPLLAAGADMRPVFESLVGYGVIALVLMVAWLVVAQYRLARNQTRIADLLTALVADRTPPGRTQAEMNPAKGETPMFRSVTEILGYKIQASDGELGKVKDFLFDDRAWAVRYLLVDTGGWLSGRQVLVSPSAMGTPDWEAGVVPVSLTTKQVEDSPDLEEDAPVSRQHESDLALYYGWEPYWDGGAPLWVEEASKEVAAKAEEGDPHLRSVREVTGYAIDATDGDVGHVDDFIADTGMWIICYMVVDTGNWLPGRKVLVSPRWVEAVDWAGAKVTVDLTCKLIKGSPEFDPSVPINREYETRLYDFYGRPKYWL